MSNISVKINLRQLKSTVRVMKAKTGDLEFLLIPIKANQLVVGEKGIYLDLMGFEIKERKPDRKDTHLVKQSFSKEVYEAMTDQEKREAPIIGNMIVWGFQEPAPNELPAGELTMDPESDDLPF